MTGALEGVRVLECTLFQQGAVSAMLLGDLGAGVMNIEEQLKGDPAKGIARVAGGTVADDLSRRNLFF